MYIYCTSKEQTEITPPWSSTRTSEQELRKYPSLCTIVHWTGTPLQCLCLRDVSPLEPLSTALMKPEVRHTITWFFTSWIKKRKKNFLRTSIEQLFYLFIMLALIIIKPLLHTRKLKETLSKNSRFFFNPRFSIYRPIYILILVKTASTKDILHSTIEVNITHIFL